MGLGKGRKARKARKDDTFQIVDGGSVRRVTFEEEYDVHLDKEPTEAPEQEPNTQSERIYRPRHAAPLDDIRFEIDHLEMIRAGHVPRNTPVDRTDLRSKARTLYTTERGGKVVEAPSPSGGRTLYTSGSNILSERRFHEKLVDDVVKDVRLDEVIVVEERVTEYVPESVAKGTKKPKVKGKTVKSGKKPAKKSVKTDTKPRVKGAQDTAPGEAGEKVLQPQCSALTAAGKQCRNSSRHTSKYCGAHKGYRAKS